MRHTCDTAPSGSERSENTCAACAQEMADRLRKGSYPAHRVGYGDLTGEWKRQTARIGTRGATSHPTRR